MLRNKNTQDKRETYLSLSLTNHPANVHSYYAVNSYEDFTLQRKIPVDDLKNLLHQALGMAEEFAA